MPITDKTAHMLETVAKGRKQFGVIYGSGHYTANDLADAIMELYEHNGSIDEALKAEVTAANRRAGAADARATKARKAVAELRAELAILQSQQGVNAEGE